jgi:hypothetical protein
VANNPCTICPDGITAGEDILPYTYDWRTCKDIINATLTFDADSEMCLVHAKQDELNAALAAPLNSMITATSAQMVLLLAAALSSLFHGQLSGHVNIWFRMPKYTKMVPWDAITTRVMKCLAAQEQNIHPPLPPLLHPPSGPLWEILH